MKKFCLSQNIFNYSLFFGLLCAAFMSFSHFNAACDDLRANVLRLHIIANSDSEADQTLKLKIRDELLSHSEDIFKGATGIDDAILLAEDSISEIESIANGVINENSFKYSAKASVGNSYFETREYDTFTLPAGEYKSLIITLGEGKGKNWWCVVFPEICLPAASKATLADSAADESAEIAENQERYIMRFKAVEIYEDLKKYLLD